LGKRKIKRQLKIAFPPLPDKGNHTLARTRTRKTREHRKGSAIQSTPHTHLLRAPLLAPVKNDGQLGSAMPESRSPVHARPLPAGHFRCQFPSRSPAVSEKKKGSPKGDHVTPASATVSPFPSPSPLPPGPSPRRQQLRRPAGQPAGPCLLVWPPSTPPAALWQLAHAQIALSCNLLRRSPAFGGRRCGRSDPSRSGGQ